MKIKWIIMGVVILLIVSCTLCFALKSNHDVQATVDSEMIESDYSAISFEKAKVDSFYELSSIDSVKSITRKYSVENPQGWMISKDTKEEIRTTLEKRGDILTDGCEVNYYSEDEKYNEGVYYITIRIPEAAFQDNPDYYNYDLVDSIYSAIISPGVIEVVENFGKDDQTILLTDNQIAFAYSSVGDRGIGASVYCGLSQNTNDDLKKKLIKYSKNECDLTVTIDGQAIFSKANSVATFEKDIETGNVFVFNLSGRFDDNYFHACLESEPLKYKMIPIE